MVRRRAITERVTELERPITARRIAPRAITSSKIAPRAVTTTKIAARAITSSKIARNSVTSSKISSDVIPDLVTNPVFNRSVLSVLPDLISTPAFDKVVRSVLPELIAHPTFDSAVRQVLPELVATPSFAQAIRAAGLAKSAEGASPQGAPGPQGPAGAQGATGPSGIIDIKFSRSNEPVLFVNNAAMVELTLPPIVLMANQVVKLDAFANVDLNDVQSYSVNSFVSRNPTDIVATDNEAIFQDPNQPNFQQVTVTTSLTWVDDPGPGTYNYSYTIIASAPGGISEGTINSRGFTAMVVNSEGDEA